jgi:hypothetical protein
MVVNWTTDWIAANRELIAQALERKIAKFGEAFEFLAGVGQKVLAVPWVGEFLKGVDASTAFDIGLAGLGLTMAGPLFAAVQVLTAAVWRMNAAMWANPWVLFAAAVAGAAYAIYANWGPITAWFDEQMTAIRTAFDRGLGSGLWEIFTRFNAFTLIAEAVNGLSKWLFGIDLFAAGRRLMQGLIDGIKSLLPDLSGVWATVAPAFDWLSRNTTTSVEAAVPESARAITEAYRARYLPQPPAPGSPAAMAGVAAPQKSEVTVKVDFANTPHGATVKVDGSGGVKIERSVGYSMQDNT